MKKKYLNLIILISIIFVLSGCKNDIFDKSLKEKEVFSILKYEITTIGSKYIYSFKSIFSKDNKEYAKNSLIQFKSLTKNIYALEKEPTSTVRSKQKNIEQLEKELTTLRKKRNSILLKIEKDIQKIVRNQIKAEGIDTKGFVFPPVSIKIFDPPLLLVTSPRNLISREKEILLDSSMKNSRKNIIEQKILDEENLSAVILEIGGLASYPSMIKPNTNFERLFELTAHEWLHQYLIFYPLGRSIFKNNEMNEINETLANIFGKEISKKICANELYEIYCENSELTTTTNKNFDYDFFMKETRETVDLLLKNNNISKAEKYMEERRKNLENEGILIRKINQAWFAFHGTYTDSPTSVSPVFSILKKIQEDTENMKEFIDILKNIDSYQQFLTINDYK
ncbi:MAG: hypothetical protein QF496_00605 [Dehalococcoidia bacterium]|nr:hypothetical protein [Dehalococcoidia bacterium]